MIGYINFNWSKEKKKWFHGKIFSKKIVCKSNEGNITIRYNDKTIVGYSATKLAYDMEGQKTIANKIGIDAYIEEFKTWFKTNTTGTCK